jgi:hypothetical protein
MKDLALIYGSFALGAVRLGAHQETGQQEKGKKVELAHPYMAWETLTHAGMGAIGLPPLKKKRLAALLPRASVSGLSGAEGLPHPAGCSVFLQSNAFKASGGLSYGKRVGRQPARLGAWCASFSFLLSTRCLLRAPRMPT